MDSGFNAISIIEQNDMVTTAKMLRTISQFQAVVQQSLKKDVDYGVIPGTQKPTLFLPGAQKINMLMAVSPEYEFLSSTEDFDKGFFNYSIRCFLYKNIVQDGILVKLPVAQGVGSCNSYEKKYRFVNVDERNLPEGVDKASLHKAQTKWGTKYQMDNPNIADLANTILKMAKKRALVDATLQFASLSEVFTQDLEDLKDIIAAEQSSATVAQPVTKTVESSDPADYVITFGKKYPGKTLREIHEANDDNYLQYIATKMESNTPSMARTVEVVRAYLLSIGKPNAPVAAPAPKTAVAQARQQAQEDYPAPSDDDLPFTLN